MKETEELYSDTEQCLFTWNIPHEFKTYIEPIATHQINKWKELSKHTSSDTQQFINIFKTFCGCGIYEDYSIYKNTKNTPHFSFDQFDLPNEFCPCNQQERTETTILWFVSVHENLKSYEQLTKKVSEHTTTILDSLPAYFENYIQLLDEIFDNVPRKEFINFSYHLSKRINFFTKILLKMDYKVCFWNHMLDFIPQFWKNYFTHKTGKFYKNFYGRIEEMTIEEFSKIRSEDYCRFVRTIHYFNFEQKDFDSFNDFAKIYTKSWENEISPRICKIDYQIQEKTLKPFNEVLRLVSIEHKAMFSFFKLIPCPTKKYMILLFLKRLLKLNELSKYCMKKLFLNTPLTDDDQSLQFPCIRELKSIFNRMDNPDVCIKRKFAKFVRENHEDLIDCFLLFKEITGCFVNNERACKYVKAYQEQQKEIKEECPLYKKKKLEKK
eukprot:gene4658-8231_t